MGKMGFLILIRYIISISLISISSLLISAILIAKESGEELSDVTKESLLDEGISREAQDQGEAGAKDESVKTKKCPKCNRLYTKEVNFCAIEGEKLVDIMVNLICPVCKQSGAPGELFCKTHWERLIAEDLAKDKAEDGKGGGKKQGKSESRYEEIFKKAMEHIEIGDLLRKERNDYANAIEEYKKAEELMPDLLQLHYKMAGAYWKLGNPKEALKHLDRCKELYPEGEPGKNKIEQYIAKLEENLSKEEKASRIEKKRIERKRMMEEALEKDKAKWSEMVLVPEGKFLMGSKEDEFNIEEKPEHEVYLSAYYIDKYEVTNALYWEFLEYIAKTNDHSKCYIGEAPNKDHTPDRWYEDRYYDHPGWPVMRVDWYDAYAFAAWAGKRLSTEAEWEKAARGTDGRRFPWGNIWEQKRCNVGETGPLEVGSYPEGQSVYGCCDMSGSVQEWCQDWHHAMYYKNSPTKDPKGPLEPTNIRAIRGSSLFANNVYQMRVTIRWYDEPHRRNRSVGFRCAKDAKDEGVE